MMSLSYGKRAESLDGSLSRSVTEVFLKAITIASAFNKVLRKQILKPDTIRLIPTGGYSGNVSYNKKSLMRLVYREKTDGAQDTAREQWTRVQAARTPTL